MNIVVNDEPKVVAARTLATLIGELGLADARIATAVDGAFVPASGRENLALTDGMKIEIVAPRQGG
ncbi:thiamine biosynthesis protein ThiS [Acetobacter estunensis NRIC 0472]|uniref:Sulfur carrier protein ThiS n=1 Tax=Acetobacter estunensis TaxID=104097 RepID=A0A967B6B4_9PROT|nr:sulfur carrier protein ThiS [Acetobacter estunensis]MBV1835865.1 sulfur carrier protein ThiS [Acetobacter estunensis]MBV1835874.1 sulfur carrier protein ThiS [Acetobacter estunensis]NHO53209.1 sulfur carrier protein ThiS [Acetobacter estunensis]GBQ23805.1 thiamine biosynthesis protein ThiS [Acetobacter estunensis NRIC 0472]